MLLFGLYYVTLAGIATLKLEPNNFFEIIHLFCPCQIAF